MFLFDRVLPNRRKKTIIFCGEKLRKYFGYKDQRIRLSKNIIEERLK